MVNCYISEWIDKIIQYGILAVWVFLPLAFGSVHVWAYVSAEIAVWVLVGLSAIGSMVRAQSAGRRAQGAKSIHTQRESEYFTFHLSPFTFRNFFTCPLHIFMFIGLVLVFMQIVPLPLQKIKLLSPEAFASYKRVFDIIGGNIPEWIPLSLFPYATRVEWFKLLACVALFELVFYKVTERKDLQRLILVWVVMGIFQSFYGLLQSIDAVKGIWWWKDTFAQDQSIGTFIYRNHFGTYMAMLVPLFIGLFFSEINGASRKLRQIREDISRDQLIKTLSDILTKTILTGLVVVFVVVGFVLSGSRGGIMACASAFIITSVFLCFRKDTRRYGFALLILFGMVVAYNLYLTFDRTVERFSSSSSDVQGRIEFTKHAWEMSEKFPITGSGWGTFEELYRRYKPPTSWNKAVDHAHNDWVELLTETGWGGPAIALIAFIVFIVIVFKKWMEQANRHSRWSKWVGFGCIVGVITPLIHATGDFVLRCPAVTMTWFGLMAVTWNVVHLREAVQGSRFKVQGSKQGAEAAHGVERMAHGATTNHSVSQSLNHSSPITQLLNHSITIILLIVFVAFYAWWGWSVMKHGIAQAYVPTEINSTIKTERVMAIDKLLYALNMEPDNAELWFRLAEATSILPDKTELDMIDGWVKKKKIDIHGDRNNLALYANAFLREAITRNPTNPKPFAYFGWIYGYYGRYDFAERALSMSIYLDPYNPEWYYLTGLIEYNMGLTDIAKTFFKMATEIDPEYKRKTVIEQVSE
ncbi:MAG: O-antigen ligase family protein [Proteobacteria bacterium]|nr:O-antigen ligase family protein [Pseudomonadota bacterium]